MKKQKYNWPEIITRWQKSGHSNQAAFCRDQGLSYWSFREALKRGGKSGSFGKQEKKQPRSKKEAAFVKLAVENFRPEPTENNTSAIPKSRKPWLALVIGPQGFQFEINLEWRR